MARLNGEIIPLSVDHKPEDEEELIRIQHAGGYVQEMRVCSNLNLSRCLGDFTYKLNSDLSYKEQMITCDADIKTVERKPNQDDILVVACDGIWDCLTN